MSFAEKALACFATLLVIPKHFSTLLREGEYFFLCRKQECLSAVRHNNNTTVEHNMLLQIRRTKKCWQSDKRSSLSLQNIGNVFTKGVSDKISFLTLTIPKQQLDLALPPYGHFHHKNCQYYIFCNIYWLEYWGQCYKTFFVCNLQIIVKS